MKNVVFFLLVLIPFVFGCTASSTGSSSESAPVIEREEEFTRVSESTVTVSWPTNENYSSVKIVYVEGSTSITSCDESDSEGAQAVEVSANAGTYQLTGLNSGNYSFLICYQGTDEGDEYEPSEEGSGSVTEEIESGDSSGGDSDGGSSGGDSGGSSTGGSSSGGSSDGGDSGGPSGPTVTIDGGSLVNISSSNVTSFPVSGTCSEDGREVTVSVGGVSPSSQPSCSSGTWSTTVDLTSLNQTSGSISILADHSDSEGNNATQSSESVTNNFVCPTNFVPVPPLAGYTTNSFCLSKYEMKNDGSNNAISQAASSPYVSINRNDAITKCTAMGSGYDLITNDQWQTVARNVELVPSNWSNGTIGDAAGLSIGGKETTAAADTDIDNACVGTTDHPCDSSTWALQRRIFTLSNDEVIWDFAGNAFEWVKDDNSFDFGTGYLSEITAATHPTTASLSGGTTTTARNTKDQFGPAGTTYTNTGALAYLRFGRIYGGTDGAIFRGACWSSLSVCGVFMAYMDEPATYSSGVVGFRCTYAP